MSDNAKAEPKLPGYLASTTDAINGLTVASQMPIPTPTPIKPGMASAGLLRGPGNAMKNSDTAISNIPNTAHRARPTLSAHPAISGAVSKNENDGAKNKTPDNHDGLSKASCIQSGKVGS